MKQKNKQDVVFRISEPVGQDLFDLLFHRYPDKEWGTFVRVGYRITPAGIVLTLQSLLIPNDGDIDTESWIVEIQSQYTSRMLRDTEEHSFAIGFIHSHPQDYETTPSPSDYDMEAYYADLLKTYTTGRPFVSLIFGQSSNGRISATGRVFVNNEWYDIDKFIFEGKTISIGDYSRKKVLTEIQLRRVKRLVSQFSEEAANSLADSTVGIIGASGTGSPCIELLARAGVGKLIIVDPEMFEDSNLERLHGSAAEDVKLHLSKVEIAGRHVKSINPDCEIILIKGRLPQKEVLNEMSKCDIVIGATDLHSSRAALSDLSLRYLVPVIDTGVVMEGSNGVITGQVIQINRLFPADPCVYCRNMVDSQIIQQELMTDAEQVKLKEEAIKAKEEGRDNLAYWIDMPQLNTVGYLTTMAGSMVVNYVIGYLTQRFKMKSNFVELNFSKHGIQVVERNAMKDAECRCHLNRGAAEQDFMAITSVDAEHWQEATYIS